MELLPIFRLLSRRRLLITLGVLCAIAVLVGLGGTKSATRSEAVAWTSVALDTPKSQLVDVAPTGADTLPWRASLLTHLMATSSSTQQLARQLGVRPDEVMVADLNLDVPLTETALALAASKAATSTVAPYVVTPFLTNNSLPVISIEAVGPDRAGAIRLAKAAVAVLQAQASSRGSFKSLILTNAHVLKLQPFVVDQLSPVREKMLSASKPPIMAIGAASFVFMVWCIGVLMFSARSRTSSNRRRIFGRRERQYAISRATRLDDGFKNPRVNR